MITLYCGINEAKWNGQPVTPGPFAVISPVCRTISRLTSVKVPEGTAVIQDSGAFCDGPGKRISFQAAHDRQLAHADQYKYRHMISHRASYDYLFNAAQTIEAAKFMAKLDRKTGNFVLSAQGNTPAEYLHCSQAVIDQLQPDLDIFGLGGWCAVGRRPAQKLPLFLDSIRLAVPYAAKKGVKKIHIWGVIFPKALGPLLWLCDQHGIALSTDSAGPTFRPSFGKWGYGDWKDNNYSRVPVHQRGQERIRHVAATRLWLENFRQTTYYRG